MFDVNEALDQVFDAVKEEVTEKIKEGDINVSLDDAKEVLVNAVTDVVEEQGIDLGDIFDKIKG